MLKQVHLYIKGDVIGVGFRAWTKIQAKVVGVTGWVRNTFDHPDVFGTSGGVEALLQGDQEKVEQIIALIKKGPPVSHIEDVQIFPQEVKEMFDSFEIKK